MNSPLFRRQTRIVLSRVVAYPPENIRSTPPISAPLLEEQERTVLVINSSHMMAKEITSELSISLPGCSIIYAPTIALAKLLLTRRKIHLVISAPILPDGNITQLRDALRLFANPPDVVVVGDLSTRNAELLKKTGYEFHAMRRLGRNKELPPTAKTQPQPKVQDAIKALGADIRNDLNNPLQEIVAMIFVAQAGVEASSTTTQALEAIDRAAKNIASVVKGLEDKITKVVNV